MSKHTQGEWVAVGGWVELDDETRADICSVNPCDFGQRSFGRDDDEMCANARLIAAAPDLLEALQALVNGSLLDRSGNRDDDGLSDAEHPSLKHRVIAARAAIAKATGETK